MSRNNESDASVICILFHKITINSLPKSLTLDIINIFLYLYLDLSLIIHQLTVINDLNVFYPFRRSDSNFLRGSCTVLEGFCLIPRHIYAALIVVAKPMSIY